MKKLSYCGLLLMLVLLSGCNDTQLKETVAKSQPIKTQHSVNTGKPGAPVNLSSKHQKIVVNTNTALDLSLVSMAKQGQFQVSVLLPEGLTLISGVTTYQFDLASTPLPFKLPLVVSGTEEGKYYIKLQVVYENNGMKSVRSLSQIIWVGEPSNSGAKRKEGVAGGVKVMPATETIKKSL